jgi:hypothetical protein
MDPKERARKISESHKKRLEQNPEAREQLVQNAINNILKRWKKPEERERQKEIFEQNKRFGRRKQVIVENFDANPDNLVNKEDSIFIHDKENNHYYIVVNDKERTRIARENLQSNLHDINAHIIVKFSKLLTKCDTEFIAEMQEYFEDRIGDILIHIIDIEKMFFYLLEEEGWYSLMSADPKICPTADYKENIKVGRETYHIYRVY